MHLHLRCWADDHDWRFEGRREGAWWLLRHRCVRCGKVIPYDHRWPDRDPYGRPIVPEWEYH